MIPGIEEILHGLLAGKYTEEQCLAWLNTHMELAADRDGLRDHFAAHALTALLSRIDVVSGDYVTNATPADAAKAAFRYADAMLTARSSAAIGAAKD